MRINASALVVIAGCNAVFGIRDTVAVDAQYFDGPPDAPFACPPLGTPPRFSRAFRQVVFQPCNEFTASTTAGRALAKCFEPASEIEEGQIGGQLAQAPGFERGPHTTYDYPRLGPDGDLAIASVIDSLANTTTFSTFARSGDTWTRGGDLPSTSQIYATTAPTRGANPHVLALEVDGAHELVYKGTWTDVATYSRAELGVTQLDSELAMTADGLRLVGRGILASMPQGSLLYADRPSLSDRFGLAVAMPGVEDLPNGFMTADCGELYFSALGTVFVTYQVP